MNQNNNSTVDAEKAQEEVLKLEAEARKQVGVKYRQSLKDLAELLQKKMPGTNYDRFWVDSIKMRMGAIEKVTPILDYLNTQKVGCKKEFDAWFEDYMMDEN